ncbi:MAG: HAMP domain-containing histidine kinase [Deltaproteobacteria bacterium]|nr:HAMP domain-containing histidine kinase [Deltaproteobacteria bacterium]
MQNSIQAIDGNAGTIQLETKLEDKSVLMMVSDTGPGILEEDIPKIFRADFTKGKKHGTGFGLAFCKQAIEAHGGKIQVKSKIGTGTTFTIVLPIKNIAADQKQIDQERVHASHAENNVENRI